MSTDTPLTMQYIVYQDLNAPTTVFVARGDEVVAGTFKLAAGPFDDRDEAEKEARRIKREAES